MNVKFIASLFLIVFIPSTYQSYGTKTSDGHYNDNMDVSAEGDAVNHPGNIFLMKKASVVKFIYSVQLSSLVTTQVLPLFETL